jgi:hypothetical protein
MKNVTFIDIFALNVKFKALYSICIRMSQPSSEESKELASFITATKRFKLNPQQSREMFVKAIAAKMKNQDTMNKLKEVKEDVVIQTAMKENYTKLVAHLSKQKE